MNGLSRAHEEHIRELLQAAGMARDLLPYTPEFDSLKGDFYLRAFRKMSDAEFWRAVVNVAKKGGVRGKRSSIRAPSLTQEQRETLRRLLPVPIGERDKLPYGDKFPKFVRGFNSETGLALTEREVWLAVLHEAK